MTTARTKRSVLIIGRSQRVLDDAVAGVRALGYRAAATNDFFSNITGRFAPSDLDLVVFGGQVPPDRRAEIRAEIEAINPRVLFVQGLAGIPGLIVNQIQGAFTADTHGAVHAARFDAAERTIALRLARPSEVTLTAWWTTSVVPPDPTSDFLVLLDGTLPAGDHVIPIPDHIPPERAFASVQVGAAIDAFSIESFG